MDGTLLVLGVLQVIAILTFRWVGRVYMTQPSFNHPDIFRNPTVAAILVYGPIAAMVVMVVLAFLLTDHPWWFLALSIAGWVACSPSPNRRAGL